MMEKYYPVREVVDTPDKAEKLLTEGNRRFVSGNLLPKDMSEVRRTELAIKGQKPFAVILTCSDSRVPPEIIFDQGMGDLFVVRVAGNVVDEVVMSSIIYAVELFHVPLIVVMGHDKCGAVKAVVDGKEVLGITDIIKPSVDKLNKLGLSEEMVTKVEDENIFYNAAKIRGNPQIKNLLATGKLRVLEAKYNLSSGEVMFFDSLKVRYDYL